MQFGANIFISHLLLKIQNFILDQDRKIVFIVVEILRGKMKKKKIFKGFYQNSGMGGLEVGQKQIKICLNLLFRL